MKKNLVLILHAITTAPLFLIGFLVGYLFWVAYAGFFRARDVQTWLTDPPPIKLWKSNAQQHRVGHADKA